MRRNSKAGPREIKCYGELNIGIGLPQCCVSNGEAGNVCPVLHTQTDIYSMDMCICAVQHKQM